MQAQTYGISKIHLNAIATRALIDEDFKAGVLNGKRSQKIQEYPLPEIIQQEVMKELQYRGTIIFLCLTYIIYT